MQALTEAKCSPAAGQAEPTEEGKAQEDGHLRLSLPEMQSH